MDKKDFLRAGKIVGVHGVGGNVKVYSYCESVETILDADRLVLKKDGGRESVQKINWAKPHKNLLLISFEGIEGRDAAEGLVGSVLFIERKHLPELEEGTYYWNDLIGMTVNTTGGERLGILKWIMETGSNDVYVVRDGKRETLVPALESVVKSVDLEGKTLTVEMPEGL